MNVNCRRRNILLFMGSMLVFLHEIAVAAPLQGEGLHGRAGVDWSIHIGALGMYKPEYEGSDDYEVTGFPLIDISWRDTLFFNPRRGLGAYVWAANDIKLGLSIGYTPGRDEDDSRDLEGLGDIDGGAMGNVFFAWAFGDVGFGVGYGHQITGGDTGFHVNLDISYNFRVEKKTFLKSSIRTTYASSEYMEEYFGISASQSIRSDLPVYDVGSGFKSYGFQLMVITSMDRHWGVQAIAGYDRLIGDAGGSPVVREENQFRIGLGLSYQF